MPQSGHYRPNLLRLGRAIRSIRLQRGLTADDLAAAAGLDRQRVDALEGGAVDPSYELLLALADALGIQPSELVILAEQLGHAAEP